MAKSKGRFTEWRTYAKSSIFARCERVFPLYLHPQHPLGASLRLADLLIEMGFRMALYHFSIKTISRNHGRSAVAAAAYRSGQKLEDDFYGLVHDYQRKKGVEFSQIFTPDGCDPRLKNRQYLWNYVEETEKRKNSTVAREFEIAFPCELNKRQRQEMLEELCRDIMERHKVVVDASIHAPHTISGTDARNFHAHILMSTREATPTGFGVKTRKLDNQCSGEVQHWREHFANLTNRHLEKAGCTERVDHRSYRDQGLNLEAQQHEGPATTALRRKGLKNEIIVSNNLTKERNQMRLEQQNDLEELQHTKTQLNASMANLTGLQHEKTALEKKIDEIATDHAQKTFWDFQDKYKKFLADYNQTTDLDRRAEAIQTHNLLEEIDAFHLATLFLRKKQIEPKRKEKKLWLSLFKKEEEEPIFITADEILGYKETHLAQDLQHIEKLQQAEKHRLKQQRIDDQKAFEHEQEQEKAELSRRLEIDRYFKDFDQTGLRRDFESAFRDHLYEVKMVGLMTQLQAQDFVNKDYKAFEKDSRTKYQSIGEIIKKCNVQELDFLQKIIRTDQKAVDSVAAINIQPLIDEASQAIQERKEDIQWQATQKPKFGPAPTPKKPQKDDMDLNF